MSSASANEDQEGNAQVAEVAEVAAQPAQPLQQEAAEQEVAPTDVQLDAVVHGDHPSQDQHQTLPVPLHAGPTRPHAKGAAAAGGVADSAGAAQAGESGKRTGKGKGPGLVVLWERFPKFVLGFLVLSVLISLLSFGPMGRPASDAIRPLDVLSPFPPLPPSPTSPSHPSSACLDGG